MRTLSYFSFLLFSACLLVACSGTSSPGAAAKQYADYFYSGKYEKFVDGIASPEGEEVTKEQVELQKQMLLSTLKEKGQKTLEEKGKASSVEIVSEDISEDGNSATVILKVTFGDGDVEDITYDMVKEKGVWKMAFNK